MFFLLRNKAKHKSALLDTIDFARGDGPCPSIAAARPHDVFLLALSRNLSQHLEKKTHGLTRTYSTGKKHCQPPADTLLRQTKTTPSGVQPLFRKEADQTDHGEIITFRCLRTDDVITTPVSLFSSSCLAINGDDRSAANVVVGSVCARDSLMDLALTQCKGGSPGIRACR